MTVGSVGRCIQHHVLEDVIWWQCELPVANGQLITISILYSMLLFMVFSSVLN